MPDLSRPFRRRDAALPRRQVEGAGQGQTRAGGGRGNSAVDIFRRRDRERARRAFDAPHLLFLPKTVFASRPTFHRLHQPHPAAAQIDAPLYGWGMRIVVGPHRCFGLERPTTICSRRILPPATPISIILSMAHHRQARHRAARRQARHLHRRERGGDRSSVWATGFGRASRSSTPPTSSMSRASRSCSSTPSAASSTISSWRDCSAGRRRRVADRRLSGAADRGLHQGSRGRSEARGVVPGAESARPSRYRPRHRWKDTPWHRFEIQHYRFRRYMKRLFGSSARRRARGRATHHADRRRFGRRGQAQARLVTLRARAGGLSAAMICCNSSGLTETSPVKGRL